MEDEKPKRGESNQTAAYILIGIGILFLLVNVLDISWGRLWPLVLVILGLYLLFGRNNIGSPAKTGYFSAPLSGAKSARVNLHLSVGEAIVTPLTGSDKLIDAEVHYVGEIDFSVSGEEEKIVTLRQTSDSGLHWINPATDAVGELIFQAASCPNRVVRVCERGFSAYQFSTRVRFIAAAVSVFCRWVFSSPR